MIPGQLAFAVPGDITNRTGGTIYDRRVIEDLQTLGWDVRHVALPASFPEPSSADMSHALTQLAAVPKDMPLIIDGLAFGALDPDGVAELASPLVPLVHHPLAEESGMPDALRTRLRQTERTNLARANHVIVPSPHTADLLVRGYEVPAERITIARPGTDPVSGIPTPDVPPLILSVGIQVPRKGHDILIKALSHVADLDWNAVIVGAPLDMVFSETLLGLRAKADLDQRVQITGLVDQSDLEIYYRKASLFALSTRYEGYGIVFDEALAHGLPIVSCVAGAVADTVPRKAGLLVPPEDPEAFSKALRRMLSEPEFRAECARAARAAGEALPSWRDTAKTIARALNRHLGR